MANAGKTSVSLLDVVVGEGEGGVEVVDVEVEVDVEDMA